MENNIYDVFLEKTDLKNKITHAIKSDITYHAKHQKDLNIAGFGLHVLFDDSVYQDGWNKSWWVSLLSDSEYEDLDKDSYYDTGAWDYFDLEQNDESKGMTSNILSELRQFKKDNEDETSELIERIKLITLEILLKQKEFIKSSFGIENNDFIISLSDDDTYDPESRIKSVCNIIDPIQTEWIHILKEQTYVWGVTRDIANKTVWRLLPADKDYDYTLVLFSSEEEASENLYNWGNQAVKKISIKELLNIENVEGCYSSEHTHSFLWIGLKNKNEDRVLEISKTQFLDALKLVV
ncbi:hypothetical protein [Tenacibaculum sp. nBUS_03]|uniref:hypothetical protein n=1 Tax=Tenacibaculum sp. nBUS_03 TaxID=3395320 RepID=UPI003EB7B775